MKQRIFILWASWNVWRELIKQIVENDGVSNHVNPSEIIWIANSNSYIFNSGWIDKKLFIRPYLKYVFFFTYKDHFV